MVLLVVRKATVGSSDEETLRASEQRYQLLFSHMLNGFAHCRMIYDDEHRPVDFEYLSVNEAFGQLTGLVDVVGKRVSEVVPGIRERSPELFAVYGRVASTGIAETFDFDFKSQNQWLSIRVYSPESGTFVAVFEDITGRKQAEADLLLQSAALNAAADAMVITDRDGTIVWVNPAFTELTEYAARDAVGQNTRLLKSGEQAPAIYASLWETLLSGLVWRGELINRKKGGTVYPESQTITPVKGAGGAITHFIAIKRDLTQQRLLERQYVQAQKMETVGRLAGGVAHDFNNLLTVINGRSELALMDLREGDALHGDLTEVLHAGRRAVGLTRQLLAFSRKQVLQPDVLTLDSVVADVKGMLDRLIGEDVNLVFESGPDLGRVKVDRGQLEQVIMNLVINARDAMPKGGTLTIETGNVEIEELDARRHPSMKAGPHVMLAISDTGVGMDAATRERLFEPFFTTKGPNKGTGLGLATVYGIVKQSGGSIWAYSEVGKGSSFKIYLPRVEDEASAARVPSAPVAARGSETVLVVEDESAVRALAERMLQSAGYTVLLAAGGDDAVSRVEQHDGPVDLLLTDVVMPGMSGRDLAARLAELRPRMKVLYTSGYTDDAIVHHGVLDPDTRFISKPYGTAELTRKVREALDS
jgi:two-component system, cell cycle sensor histidine kinase and response regulator CckA